MTKTEGRKRAVKAHVHKPVTVPAKGAIPLVESYLPAGSPQRTAAEIAAAAIGALIVAAVIGLGPAALAGTAGYVMYRETKH
jgi:hypothetical protein